MQSFDTGAARKGRTRTSRRLDAIAAVILTLGAGVPSGYAQQAATVVPDKSAADLPQEPAPTLTQPLNLRQSPRDFSKPAGRMLGNPIKPYLPTTISKSSFLNSPRLTDMVKDGKIYLSLSDALALALENNYDIAISRYYMDLADLDILRAKAGSTLFGSGATVNSNTQGGYIPPQARAAAQARHRAVLPASGGSPSPRPARVRRPKTWIPWSPRPFNWNGPALLKPTRCSRAGCRRLRPTPTSTT